MNDGRGTAAGVVRDTIAAVATPRGAGAIAIVRVSGPAALEIAERLTGRKLRPRHVELCAFNDEDGQPIDHGIALFFPGPRSYTGEDVVELHGHGGPVVVDWLLESVLGYGARAADPGEFTLRAFLNEKLDLTQAEAVAALIESGSRQAAQAALRSLAGRFSDHVRALQQALTETRAVCEAWLDFPEEDLDPGTVAGLKLRFEATEKLLEELLRSAAQGAILTDGLSIAIAGPPNAGKSSLLNRLAARAAAIVTDLPGTTRDTVRERILVDGMPVDLVDTAGLRESADRIEREGVRRAQEEIEKADHVLWVADIQTGLEAALAGARHGLGTRTAFTLVLNKVDLSTATAGNARAAENVPVLRISALTGAGMESLTTHLKDVAGLNASEVGTLGARRRHLDALRRAQSHVRQARPHFPAALELCAEELRGAQRALSELTGEHTSDDLLGEIFSSFCIGK